MRSSVQDLNFRNAVIGVTAVAMVVAMAAPAAALELLLPEEDRRWMLADDTVAVIRFFDLLPVDAQPSEEAGRDAAESSEEGDDDAEVVHEIAAGESLADVAVAYGIPGVDGWRRLYDANPDITDPNLVEVGTLVRIPDADEELEVRDLPAPPRPAPGTSRSAGAGVWDRLAACESGGNWAANTGNGYYGGLQFSLRSWQAVGGTGMPHEHDRGTQIAMGERLRAAQGWGAWPSCSRRLGLR